MKNEPEEQDGVGRFFEGMSLHVLVRSSQELFEPRFQVCSGCFFAGLLSFRVLDKCFQGLLKNIQKKHEQMLM